MTLFWIKQIFRQLFSRICVFRTVLPVIFFVFPVISEATPVYACLSFQRRLSVSSHTYIPSGLRMVCERASRKLGVTRRLLGHHSQTTRRLKGRREGAKRVRKAQKRVQNRLLSKLIRPRIWGRKNSVVPLAQNRIILTQ